MQPFDEVLDRRIYSLGDQQMHWEFDLGVKRKTEPGQLVVLIEDGLARRREVDATENMNMTEEKDDEDDEELEEEQRDERRWEDIDQTWRKASALLNEMEQVRSMFYMTLMCSDEDESSPYRCRLFESMMSIWSGRM